MMARCLGHRVYRVSEMSATVVATVVAISAVARGSTEASKHLEIASILNCDDERIHCFVLEDLSLTPGPP